MRTFLIWTLPTVAYAFCFFGDAVFGRACLPQFRVPVGADDVFFFLLFTGLTIGGLRCGQPRRKHA